jgi:hypothetical protein
VACVFRNNGGEPSPFPDVNVLQSDILLHLDHAVLCERNMEGA